MAVIYHNACNESLTHLSSPLEDALFDGEVEVVPDVARHDDVGEADLPRLDGVAEQVHVLLSDSSLKCDPISEKYKNSKDIEPFLTTTVYNSEI